ncbi:PDZ and LIM domain protein Zasp isoform X6 [Drosophila busckii]|uniref:PDZ and LIM domain protein Zasp isoform X6 n=1 Tax=Drosophila busckii TaxID=30019 RepID=UPI001432E317|nr:PDZ and LIM domain protein Zasp isoform X6 [Drosophila busckii]
MAQPQMLQVKLSRFDAQPWGFRLQGGVDFAQPLLVQKVNAGSLSEQAGLQPGDAVIKINDVDVFSMRHKDAQDIVVRSGNNFVITVQRGGSTWRPHVTPTGNVPQANSPYLQTVTKTSLAHHQQDSQHIGCGYNNSARPFGTDGGDGVKSIVNKQYNTPVGIYSDESIAETLSAQAEVLAGGVLGVNFKKNEKEYQADRSEVLKFLREEETGQSTPEPHSPANFYWTQSHAIGGNERRTPLPHSKFEQDERIGTNLQQNTLAPAATHRPSLPVAKQQTTEQQQQQQQVHEQELVDPRIIVMPICPALQGPDYKAEMQTALAAAGAGGGAGPRTLSASGHPPCQLCGVGIVGVFVRIKDKNLHVECFKCATCGTSLKNQGYYNFNNKLYCDIHAKQAAQSHPPPGTEGYVPVPIKPNTKLSANTISSALSSHGYGNNGYANGNSTPTPAPVNQGYVRPFGAQSAPKSPVPMASYPPQQQQQQSPRAAAGANAYATLPRSNVGQQVQSTSYTSHASSVNTSSLKCDAHELIEEIADELEHSEVLFPPPSPLSHLKGSKAVQSGLHKADTIPKYQRNWTSLPTQSPIRTPEPQEWRDNLPLAFVGVPATAQAPAQAAGAAQPNANTVHRPIAKLNGAQVSAPTQVVVTPASVPIIIEDRSGPVTMAFQSLDAYECADQAQTPVRPYTPCSSLTNKPAPIIPFYQTAEKLCFEECSATHARDYNQGAASPFPDRARSPAPGPPPNPLAAIRAPRMKEPETALLTANRLQTGSITTGQSYQGQLLAHSEQSSQSASQSYTQQPERVSERQLGNMHIQQREQSSQLQQQQQAQSQSQTKTQVGNMQIERRRKVTEEFERTQSAKTIEIRSSSSSAKASIQSQSQIAAQQQQQMQQQQSEASERRLSYGKTGYVANQARRLSEMEQEISSLTSQSQSISARASGLSEGGCFPNLRSPTFDSKFPLKPASPSVEIAQTNKLLGPPPGFVQQQQQQKSAFSKAGGYTQQLRSAGAASSSVASSVTSATSSFATATATKASSAITTTTNNQACAAYRGSQAAKLPAFNNNGSRSNASLAATAAIAAAVTPTAPAPAPASFPPNLADLQLDSNVDGSTGAGGKGGAFGATSAPKRGRGILNKAAGPGVRIPLCNSCNVQIRGPFITALGRIWCPDHFICVNGNCRRPLQDIGFVEEKGDLYCEYCFEKFLAPTCSKCAGKIKGDCLNAIGKHFHPECFTCGQCGKVFGNTPFFLEDGNAYCEADWNELFTTKCFACGFPVEAGDRWVEALNHNYHSQCFNCTYCKQNLEGQSFYNKGGRPFCKNHAR